MSLVRVRPSSIDSTPASPRVPKHPSAASRSAPRKASWFLVAFMVSLVIPIFFYVGDLRLAPFLVILLVLFIPLVAMWLSGYAGPPILPDYLIAFVCLWSTLALAKAHGMGDAIVPAGVIWIQTFGSYLIGRVFVTNGRQLKAVALIYALIVLALLPFVIVEAVIGRDLYLEVFSQVGSTYDATTMEPRWGLDRAQVAFEHPILFGIYVTSLFSLIYFQLYERKGRAVFVLALPAIIGSGVFSLSTGALLCLVVQFGLIAWDWFMRSNPRRWRMLMILVGLAYITVDMLSNRTPFHVFVDYLTFNSGSAYNRILIWNYGTAEVWRNPLFGIGLNEWIRPHWMSPSMDNFWLVVAVRYGLPAFLALAAALVIIVVRAGNAPVLNEAEHNLRKGLLISIVSVFVAISSVHLWNATFCWLMFLVGSAVWLAGQPSAAKQLASGTTRHPGTGHLRQPSRAYLPNATRAASSVRRDRTSRGGGRL